jgi:hypothetical protein
MHLLKELASLQDLEEISDNEEEEADIPASNPYPLNKFSSKEKPVIPEPEPVLAVKKPRTDKQIAAFQMALDKRKENQASKRQDRADAAEAERKILEEKLIKKAIALKRKQMKARAVIDDLPEEDEPVLKTKVEQKENIRESSPEVPVAKPTPAFRFF